MSGVGDLPASAKRRYKPESTIELEGLLTRQIDRAEITWLVPSTDLVAFLNVVAGTAQVIGGGGGTIIRVIPLIHPEFPWLLADGARVRQFGFDTNYYKWADVTVRFRTPTWDLDGANAFLTQRSVQAGRWMQCEAAIAVFTDGTTHPTADPGIFVPGLDLSLTIHQLPYLPWSYNYPYQRYTNLNAFWGYPKGTVLYLGPGVVRSTSMAGVTTYEVDQRFQVSSIPWNQEFRPDGTLDDVYVNGVLRYPYVDFSVLFQ